MLLDVTIGSTYISNYMQKGNVLDEESYSDNKHKNYEIGF